MAELIIRQTFVVRQLLLPNPGLRISNEDISASGGIVRPRCTDEGRLPVQCHRKPKLIAARPITAIELGLLAPNRSATDENVGITGSLEGSVGVVDVPRSTDQGNIA